MQPLSKSHHLSDPVATTGDRVYVISTQNGLFPDFTSLDHSTHEMWGVWDHPIKLLDGYWFALHNRKSGSSIWLSEASSCQVAPTFTQFNYQFAPWQAKRRDFVPDGIEGLIVSLTLYAPERHAQDIELLALFRSDLQPAWLGEQVGMIDHPDRAEVLPDGQTLLFQDEGNPWFVAVTVDGMTPESKPREIAIDAQLPAPQQTVGKGMSGRFAVPLIFDNEGFSRCTFYIAGSMESAAAAQATLGRLRSEATTLFNSKERSYQSILDHSALKSPDATINEAFAWSKVNFQRHLRTVPGMGSGVGAGLPSYPWWFGIDSEYAIPAMLQCGLFESSMATLRLLKEQSEKHNQANYGLIVHELVTNGIVYNPGNIVEVPVFVRAVAETWRWTGDRDFLAEMYPFCKTALLDYALGTCDPDGDLCPSGRSIIETLEMHAGFECIDVAAYTWEALHALIELASAMDDSAIIPTLKQKTQELRQCIQNEWWLEEEGLFADVRATRNEVKSALARLEEMGKNVSDEGFHRQVNDAKRWFAPQIELAQSQNADLTADLDRHWLLRHWVVMTPVEVQLATQHQARRVLDRLESDEFCGTWGMYLHPERHDAMSINTGLLALSEIRYGRTEQALRFVSLLASQLNYRMPGSISEALPDQWCFLQLWSGLGVISPVVEGFLGIEPNAAQRSLRIVPNLPAAWDTVSLTSVRVADAYFDIHVERTPHQISVSVTATASDFELILGAHVPNADFIANVRLNGQPVAYQIEQANDGERIVCRHGARSQQTQLFTLSL